MLTEPRGARIDLEINYPMLPTQSAMIARSLEGLERPEVLDIALRHAHQRPARRRRETFPPSFSSRDGWSPSPEQIVFTANGRQCIAAALAAVVPAGGRCGVEALTYPFIKDIAARLGVTLVPLAMDEDGVRPDAVQKAHREAHLSALYIQPTIQNPLGMTMPPARRADMVRVVEKLGLPVIEDTVYGFLDEETPMAALAPDSCIMLDSLSKKVAPGLALGFIVSPPRLRERIMAAVRSGGWTASGFAFAAGQRLMADGTVAELSRLKRIDAARRQQMAAEIPRRFRDPGQRQVLPSLAHFAAALALADIRRGRGPARHRADPFDHLRRDPRPCPQRRPPGARRPLYRTARSGAAHALRNADGERGRRYNRVKLAPLDRGLDGLAG